MYHRAKLLRRHILLLPWLGGKRRDHVTVTRRPALGDRAARELRFDIRILTGFGAVDDIHDVQPAPPLCRIVPHRGYLRITSDP